MNYYQILKITGIILLIFSFFLLLPLVAAIYYDDNVDNFIKSFLIVFFIGLLTYLPNKREKSQIRIKEGFLIVTIFWFVLSIFGSIPFLFDSKLNISLIDAIFESTSGWTTTGATVMTSIESLSPPLLLYRQLLQWLGGIGIVVLVLAILPILGVGGMYLYKAETSSPIKDNKLSPRITETAKSLWGVYVILTFACAGFYYSAGMNFFDAISHSFSTVSIGGFSTHTNSIGFYDSDYIKIICMFFMFLSALNFVLHFLLYKTKSFHNYFINSEAKSFLIIILGLLILISFFSFGGQLHKIDNIDLIFHVVSFVTTSGFTVTDYGSWPVFILTVIFLSSFIGACAGSAGGGIKVIRITIALKSIKKQLLKVIHPKAQISIKVNNKKVEDVTIETILSFIILYILLFFFSALLIMMSGHDLITSFSATAACINNLGPALGDAYGNYSALNDFSKSVLSLMMIIGRLEIYTFVILITKYFWKY
jgi:trk system potassium uptake protein TrkH